MVTILFAEKGALQLSLFMGLTEKLLLVGDDLSDDLWHTVKYERRGMLLSVAIDDDRPRIGKLLIVALFSNFL